jgi:chromosome segregation ATPase
MATEHTICGRFADLIRAERKAIRTKERLLRLLETHLAELQHAPAPDRERIEAARRDIANTEAELEVDRAQLQAAIEDFEASCGPAPFD